MNLALVVSTLFSSGQVSSVDAANVARFPERYIGRTVSVCGIPVVQEEGNIVLWSHGEADMGIHVNVARTDITDRQYKCVIGTFERKDGLTEAEARQRYGGLEEVTDGPHPVYILRSVPR